MMVSYLPKRNILKRKPFLICLLFHYLCGFFVHLSFCSILYLFWNKAEIFQKDCFESWIYDIDNDLLQFIIKLSRLCDIRSKLVYINFSSDNTFLLGSCSQNDFYRMTVQKKILRKTLAGLLKKLLANIFFIEHL